MSNIWCIPFMDLIQIKWTGFIKPNCPTEVLCWCVFVIYECIKLFHDRSILHFSSTGVQYGTHDQCIPNQSTVLDKVYWRRCYCMATDLCQTERDEFVELITIVFDILFDVLWKAELFNRNKLFYEWCIYVKLHKYPII